jgi:WD40 repeat protein
MTDDHPEQQPSTNDNGSRIRDVVEDWLARQAAGLTQSEASLIAEHSDLMPGLGEQLRRLHCIRQAIREDRDEREAAVTLSRPPPSTPVTDGSGDTALCVRCPQCHALVPATGDAPLRTVICPQCESHFSLLGETPVELYSGRRVGDFELIRPLGSGGFGTVWQARDVRLQRTVALKIPRFRHLAEDELDLFWREARAAAHLRHPHIVPVHKIGREGPTIFLVHDYIEGTNLAQWLVEQSLTARESALLVATVADALHYAHESGIIHRDIKPSNILLDGELQPYVTDFGLAKRDMPEVTVSTTGKIVGTLAYMSPEQASGGDQEVDRRSDIYSLGVILFELLTGDVPFRGAAYSLMQRVIHDEPPHPRQLNSTIPRNLATVCLKAMAKEPSRRYTTATDLADDLRRYLTGRPIKALPIGRVGRLLRWVRRKPAVAAACGLVVTLLVLATSFSIAFAVYQSNSKKILATVAATLRGEQTRTQAALTESERQSAVAERRLAIASLERGLLLCEQQHVAEGMLWFVRSLEINTKLKPVDSELERTIRTNLAAFQDELATLRTVSRHEISNHDYIPTAVFCGENVISLDQARTARLWNVSTDVQLSWSLAQQETLRAIAVTRDGKKVATLNSNNAARVWNVDTGNPLGPPLQHQGEAEAVAISPDGRIVITAGFFNGSTCLWDAMAGIPLRETGLQQGDGIYPLAFSPDGRRVLTGSTFKANEGHTVQLWDVASGRPLVPPLRHRAWICAAAISPCGRVLLTGSGDRTVRLWDADTGAARGAALEHPIAVNACVFSPHGKFIFTAARDRTIRQWDASTGRLMRQFPLALSNSIYTLDISANGRWLLTTCRGGPAKVWQLPVASAAPLKIQHPYIRQIRDVAYSPD